MLARLDAFNQPRPRLGSLRCNPLKLERPAAQRGFSFALGGPVHKIQTGTAAIATGAFSSCLRVAPSGRRRSTFRSAGGGVGFQKGGLRRDCRLVISEPFKDGRPPHKENPAGLLGCVRAGLHLRWAAPLQDRRGGSRAPSRSLPRGHNATVVPGYGIVNFWKVLRTRHSGIRTPRSLPL
jgi:hypothetical protein